MLALLIMLLTTIRNSVIPSGRECMARLQDVHIIQTTGGAFSQIGKLALEFGHTAPGYSGMTLCLEDRVAGFIPLESRSDD